MLKYKKKLFIIIISFFIIFPAIVSAEANWTMPDPKIPIPGMKILKDMQPDCTTPDANGKSICTMPWLNEYIAGIYKYAIGIVAILATIVMMIGGVIWITAAGDSGRIGEAKQWITGAVTGMVLVFSSYTILYFVNPDLVKLKPIKVEKIVKIEPPKPSSYRHKECDWQTLSCQNGTSEVDDSYCTGTKSNAAMPCCCKIEPLPGCTWKSACGVGDDTVESYNKDDCGSNTNSTNSKCCCEKITDSMLLAKTFLQDNKIKFSTNADCPGHNALTSIQEISKTGYSLACDPSCNCTKEVMVNPKIINTINDLGNLYGNKLTITSITTGKHATDSDHYKGQAVDISISDKSVWNIVVNSLKVHNLNAFCDKGGDKVDCSVADHIHINTK